MWRIMKEAVLTIFYIIILKIRKDIYIILQYLYNNRLDRQFKKRKGHQNRNRREENIKNK